MRLLQKSFFHLHRVKYQKEFKELMQAKKNDKIKIYIKHILDRFLPVEDCPSIMESLLSFLRTEVKLKLETCIADIKNESDQNNQKK